MVKVKIDGKFWTVRWSSRCKKHWGWINREKQELVLNSRMSTQKAIDIIVHEVKHILDPTDMISEEHIRNLGIVSSRVLTKLYKMEKR